VTPCFFALAAAFLGSHSNFKRDHLTRYGGAPTRHELQAVASRASGNVRHVRHVAALASSSTVVVMSARGISRRASAR
jgi:hypothetical protein